MIAMYPGTLPVSSRPGPDSLRVLLVDDNWDFLGSAEHFLSTEPDVEVVGCASSGHEALEQVPLLKPDLVLMDVAMPQMNGLKAGRLLKNLPSSPRLVLLSVSDHKEYREEAASFGADGFLNKSDFGDSLLPMIRHIFGRSTR
jgi:DNA-binding NarL/FixJ family response regulator